MNGESCTDQGEKHEFRHVGRAKYQCKWCGYTYEDDEYADYLMECAKEEREGM